MDKYVLEILKVGMLTKLINVNSTSQNGNSEKCM